MVQFPKKTTEYSGSILTNNNLPSATQNGTEEEEGGATEAQEGRKRKSAGRKFTQEKNNKITHRDKVDKKNN